MKPHFFVASQSPRRLITPLVLASLVAGSWSTSSVAATPPTDEQRFERLAKQIESARVDQHIPGVALAVVRDDEIIFARGFGFADVETKRPVAPETIFAIGSTTKAFTAAAIGMLVDEGKMAWDDPITNWLPDFQLQIDGEDDDELLLRDMLCHRSGFTRMSLLFISGEVPRDTILRTANDAEPLAPFRQQFLYNNLMFMAAGMAAGVASDSSWESLIRERVFKPLGMDDATLTYDAAQADSRLALGYSWDADLEEWEREPMRNIDQIGPAGSINAHILDMAQWVRFQLGHGVHDSNRLLSADAHAETWTPQITIGGNIEYGFGWMLREWNDQKVVEHGGNIDGFAAQVSLLPEENLGYVLLTNSSFSPLQTGSIDIVFDAMVGDWAVDATADEAGAEVAADGGLEEFTGVYIADYAQFDEEEFTVSVKDDGSLAIDIPSQMEFTLKAVGEDGRHDFAGVPGIAASFERDDSGEVCVLRLYQNNLKFDLPRKGYTFPIETSLDELKKYVGKYRFDAMNADIEVLVKNNHLAVDVPDQMIFELHPPDENDQWQFRNNDVTQIAVSFAKGEYGAIESMTMFQMGREFEMPRLPDVAAEDVPTLEAVFALAALDTRQATLEAAAPLRLSGSARFVQSGIEGTVTVTCDAGARSLTHVDVSPFGTITTSVDGDDGWADLSFDELEELSGTPLREAQRDHPAFFLGDWRRFCDEITVEGLGEVEEQAVILVRLDTHDLPPVTLSVDAETGDILKIDAFTVVPQLGNARLPITTNLSDWREVDGLRIPGEIVVITQQNGRFVMAFSGLEQHVQTPDGFYAPREHAHD